MTTLHTLDIPQEPAALGRWLEQQLLGLNLASTIAELSAVHGTPVRQQTLEDLLGPHLDSVLTDGLQSLPLPLLQGLLRDPKLLLPLQELICLEGGGYWEARQPSMEIRHLVSSGWDRLQSQLDRAVADDIDHTDDRFPPSPTGEEHRSATGDSSTAAASQSEHHNQARGTRPVVASPQPPQVRQTAAAPRRPQAGWWSHPLLVSALSAAAAVVTITFADHYFGPGHASRTEISVAVKDPAQPGQQTTEGPAEIVPPAVSPGPEPADPENPVAPATTVASAPATWGWNRPDAIDPTLPAGAYLNRLAETAAEWDAEQPQSVAGLARRIAEFRLGCSRLLTAEHAPLPEPEKKVLLDRCRNWAKNFDTQLAAVEQLSSDATAEELAMEQTKMDTLVRKLVGKLREQAEQLS